MTKRHKHEILEIFSLYRRDKPTMIELVKCGDCDTAFPEIIDLLQERENTKFTLLGGSDVSFLAPNIKWVEKREFLSAGDPKITKEEDKTK